MMNFELKKFGLPGAILALSLCLAGWGTAANATLITFTATGNASVSGFIQLDDIHFNDPHSVISGSPVTNADITALSLTVAGFTFDLGDVTAAGRINIDNGVIPLITNGRDSIAFNGSETIAFFPDGTAGLALDGDASLALDTDGIFSFGSGDNGWESFFAVQWVVAPAAIPEPALAAVFAFGLVCIGLTRPRRVV